MKLPNLQTIWEQDPLRVRVGAFAREQGREVYLVGGALRDLLLGRPTADFDLAMRGAMDFARTLADDLGAAFVVLHDDFPTARVVVAASDPAAREEFDFCELRGPDLEADLRARDFTVNAFAWEITHPDTPLMDLSGGLADLEQGLLRALSRANLEADPLRLLRAFRFAGELNFSIEPETLGWIGELSPLITRPAGERLGVELMKLLATDRAAELLREMDAVGLLEALLPQIGPARGVQQGGHHHLDVWGHSLLTVEELERIIAHPPEYLPGAAAAVEQYAARPATRAALKLAALLHDLGKPATRQLDEQQRPWFRGHEEAGATLAAGVAERLRLTREARRLLERLIAHHLRPLNLVDMALHSMEHEQRSPEKALTMAAIRRLMREVRPHGIGLVMLALADLRACQGPSTDPAQRARAAALVDDMLVRYLAWQQTQAIKPLLQGRDLIELGLPPGPQFKQILHEVEEARAEGHISTRRQALALARKMAKGQGEPLSEESVSP